MHSFPYVDLWLCDFVTLWLRDFVASWLCVRKASVRGGLVVVVGFVAEDGEAPIELFGKEKANHLVRECHLGK